MARVPLRLRGIGRPFVGNKVKRFRRIREQEKEHRADHRYRRWPWARTVRESKERERTNLRLRMGESISPFNDLIRKRDRYLKTVHQICGWIPCYFHSYRFRYEGKLPAELIPRAVAYAERAEAAYPICLNCWIKEEAELKQYMEAAQGH